MIVGRGYGYGRNIGSGGYGAGAGANYIIAIIARMGFALFVRRMSFVSRKR